MDKLLLNAIHVRTLQDTARLLHAFLNAKVKNTFHKLNVHAAVQPSDIIAFFDPIFKQARDLSEAYDDVKMSRKPFVAVSFIM